VNKDAMTKRNEINPEEYNAAPERYNLRAYEEKPRNNMKVSQRKESA